MTPLLRKKYLKFIISKFSKDFKILIFKNNIEKHVI
jgi:hypothetical protein